MYIQREPAASAGESERERQTGKERQRETETDRERQRATNTKAESGRRATLRLKVEAQRAPVLNPRDSAPSFEASYRRNLKTTTTSRQN